jgi:hypothetical protein
MKLLTIIEANIPLLAHRVSIEIRYTVSLRLWFWGEAECSGVINKQ